MRTFKLLLVVNDDENLVARYYINDDDVHQYKIFELGLNVGENWKEFKVRSKKFLDLMNANPDVF